MTVTRGVKAFRLDGERRLHFLFHGHERSTTVPRRRWLHASQRRVRDGIGRWYRAGFHFFVDAAAVEAFKRTVRTRYVFLPVLVRGVRPKPASRVGAWLARELFVP